jgi:hypothetical protein
LIFFVVAGRRRLGDSFVVREGPITGVAFGPEGNSVFAAHDGQASLVVYDVDSDSWLNRACEVANRNLSREEWARFLGADVPYQRLWHDLPNGQGVDEALRRANATRQTPERSRAEPGDPAKRSARVPGDSARISSPPAPRTLGPHEFELGEQALGLLDDLGDLEGDAISEGRGTEGGAVSAPGR